jgi:hypothetical protein
METITTTVMPPEPATEIEEDEESDELKRLAYLMRLALFSFVTTSFFLSRSYVSTMYLVLGLATATFALEQSDLDFDGFRRWVPITLGVEAAGIVFIYCVVRLRI